MTWEEFYKNRLQGSQDEAGIKATSSTTLSLMCINAKAMKDLTVKSKCRISEEVLKDLLIEIKRSAQLGKSNLTLKLDKSSNSVHILTCFDDSFEGAIDFKATLSMVEKEHLYTALRDRSFCVKEISEKEGSYVFIGWMHGA